MVAPGTLLLTPHRRTQFLETVFTYYEQHGRHDLPWRVSDATGTCDPYAVLVSELMLQQTQVNRVLPKYVRFLELFPTVADLAQADMGDVLRAWQGLGYNRRAKYLRQAAQAISAAGAFPDSQSGLTALPGIGVNTAGAILAYAYNLPAIFVETNVRTVYIHHFFPEQANVSDTCIRDALEHTLDRTRPREFYWALMDYGTHLKHTVGNVSTRSAHHKKQPAFEGSRRQVRGRLVRALAGGDYSAAQLLQAVDDSRVPDVLADLCREGLVVQRRQRYRLV